MEGMNIALLRGNVGSDPKSRTTQQGKAILSFSVATSKHWLTAQGERKERTTWHRVVAFSPLAESLADKVVKGVPVFVSGRSETRKWQDNQGQDRYTTEVIAEDVAILERPGARAPSTGVPAEQGSYGGPPGGSWGAPVGAPPVGGGPGGSPAGPAPAGGYGGPTAPFPGQTAPGAPPAPPGAPQHPQGGYPQGHGAYAPPPHHNGPVAGPGGQPPHGQGYAPAGDIGYAPSAEHPNAPPVAGHAGAGGDPNY